MPLTPNDLLQKRFGTAFRGLVADEVYAYLRTIADELEQTLREASSASAKVQQLEDQLDEYRHMETTLRNTLVSSQKVGQEIRAEAEHRRELVLREADLEVERRLQKGEVRRQTLEQETLHLVAQRRRFEAEFASLLETHARLLHHNQDSDALTFTEPDPRQLAFDDTPAAEEPDERPDGPAGDRESA